MRYVADLFIAFGIALCCTVMAFGPLACQFGDNTIAPSDALGPRDDIGGCCDEWRPWDTEAPGRCLDVLCEPGVCRWLSCLAGVYEYESEACK